MKQLFISLSLLLLLLLTIITTKTLAQPATPPAPPGPTNVTKILEKAGQFTTFIRLLRITNVGDQINGQLNDTNNGMTIFAPPDNAFSGLPAGTLNSLTDEQKSELVQFHIVPTFLSSSQFQTLSNPVRTQAGDERGGFSLNATVNGNSVNLTSGVVNATVANSIYSDNQLAVYQLDKVLLPLSIFGPHTPAPAPAPVTPKPKKKAAAESPSTPADASDGAGLVITMHRMVGFAGLALLIANWL